MTHKFNLGDMVIARNGYCGKIVLIQNGYARVEGETSEMAFKLSELKLAEPTEPSETSVGGLHNIEKTINT